MGTQRFYGEGEIWPLPYSEPAALPGAPGAFVVFPLMCQGQPEGWMEAIYQFAYQLAEASLRPTWYERALTNSTN